MGNKSNLVDQFLSEIGTIKDISEKFHSVHSCFLKLIDPLCSLNNSHKKALQEATRGEKPYKEMKLALDELNMSVSSFSHNHNRVGATPQLYVNHIETWIRDIIDSMSMLNQYAAEIKTTEEDVKLFEEAKETYQESMVIYKNLYNLLDSYNKSVGRKVFDLKDWPRNYFPEIIYETEQAETNKTLESKRF